MPTSAKILIAEDNLPGAELLDAYLADTPYDTKQAHNGEEAIKLVAEWKPDVVLLDVMMPKLSGFEVCRKLKSDPKTSKIMILMVTALSELGDIERAVEAGTDDFLSKPVNSLEFQEATVFIRVKFIRNVDNNSSSVDVDTNARIVKGCFRRRQV